MSTDVPENIGELSLHAMEQALAKIDSALADAPADVRAALGVVRLVEKTPRRCPWYGTYMPSYLSKDTDSVGNQLRNLADSLEFGSEQLRKRDAARLRLIVDQGNREYGEYLDGLHLDDWKQQATRRMFQ